jgi:hypothetical protein
MRFLPNRSFVRTSSEAYPIRCPLTTRSIGGAAAAQFRVRRRHPANLSQHGVRKRPIVAGRPMFRRCKLPLKKKKRAARSHDCPQQ